MPIRPLTLKDKEHVLALDQTIFSGVDTLGGWSERDFDQFFNKEHCFVFFDEEHPEALLGYIFATQEEESTYISNLGADPKVGRRGIGTALMEHVMVHEEEHAKQSHRPFSLKLHVDKDNQQALQFYNKFGFKEDGQDSHGLRLTATKVPEKLQRQERQSPELISRKAVIIRNIEVMGHDELYLALEGLEPDEQAPEEVNELFQLVRSKEELNANQLNQSMTLFKLETVRTYLHNTLKEKTGNYIIYHLNGLMHGGQTNEANVNYILDKLATFPAHTDFDLLYLGGGHGDPHLGSSNLSKQQLERITKTLQDKKSHFSAVVLGSCFSTAFLGLYQPLLKEFGVTMSNSLECGGDNNFKSAMEWVRGKQNEFYSKENIRMGIDVSLENRTAFKQVLAGAGGADGDALREEYNRLVAVYREEIQNVLQDLTEEQLVVWTDEALNSDIERFITEIRLEVVDKESIQGRLRSYPKLEKHLHWMSEQVGEELIGTKLIACLQPPPTTFVVGTSTKITLFNFSQADTMPEHAHEAFQANYRAVLRQVVNKESEPLVAINELLTDFNDVAVKRQFNRLFSQSIELTAERALRAEEQRKAALEEQQHELNKKIFTEQLKMLNDKVVELDRRGASKAHKAAVELYAKLNQAGEDYFANKPTTQSHKIFTKDCTTSINEARKELDKHRGWSEFLTNLLLAIGTLGLGLVLKGAINTENNRYFFFVHETKSSRLAQAITTAIEGLVSPSTMQ